MKHIFILNPAAGNGRTLELLPKIRDFFVSSGMEYCIEVTKYPGHATEIAAQYTSGEVCRIYSVGGDGTLNEVLNGMAGSKCSLAVIPSGSGNDFVRSITTKKDLDEILKATIHGEEREIDLAKVNDRYYLNLSSVGFDALVVYNTIKYKKLPFLSGSLSYVLGILNTIIVYRNNKLKIVIDGRKMELTALLVSVANGKYCGGGMLASPYAVVDDGLLDICKVGKMNRLKVFALFPKFMKGEHGKIKEVSFDRGRKVEIECAHPIAVNIDGEVCMDTKVVFEIFPKGIKIIVPV